MDFFKTENKNTIVLPWMDKRQISIENNDRK